MRVDEVLRRSEFLVDTNIISHLVRSKREISPGIVDFFDKVAEERLYFSSVTVGEIEKGIGLIPWPRGDALEQRRRLQRDLERRLEQLCERFSGRIVHVDVEVARQWGRLHAQTERAGRKTPVVDTLIAACAVARRLVVATADGDFEAFGDVLTVYNPIKKAISGYHPRSHDEC